MTKENNKNVGYHYTSLDSLFHILDSGSIHLGNILLMNDPNEYKEGCDYLVNNLKSKGKNFEKLSNLVSTMFSDFSTKNIEVPENILNFRENIFSFSLSNNGESLSQWREYGDKGHGVCIEFNITELEKRINIHDSNIIQSEYKCLYDKNQRDEAINKLFKKYKGDAIIDRIYDDETQYTIKNIQKFLLSLAIFVSRCKNKYYIDEDELRIHCTDAFTENGILENATSLDKEYICNMITNKNTLFKKNKYGITNYIQREIANKERLNRINGLISSLKDIISNHHEFFFNESNSTHVPQGWPTLNCFYQGVFDKNPVIVISKKEKYKSIIDEYNSLANEYHKECLMLGKGKVINKITLGPNVIPLNSIFIKQQAKKIFGYDIEVEQQYDLKIR